MDGGGVDLFNARQADRLGDVVEAVVTLAQPGHHGRIGAGARVDRAAGGDDFPGQLPGLSSELFDIGAAAQGSLAGLVDGDLGDRNPNGAADAAAA